MWLEDLTPQPLAGAARPVFAGEWPAGVDAPDEDETRARRALVEPALRSRVPRLDVREFNQQFVERASAATGCSTRPWQTKRESYWR